MSLQNDLNNLTKVKGITYKNIGTPPTSQLNDYDNWWDAENKEFRTRKDNKWINSYGYGYIAGGYNGSYISNIDRLSFSFDTGIESDVGNLKSARGYGVGCNSSIHGFHMSGYSSYNSIIERITFPFKTGSSITVGNLDVTNYSSAGCNSSIHGFYMGGFNGTYRSTISRILFPHDSGTAINTGNLSLTIYGAVGCNSSTHGFSMGGDNGVASRISTINRITFPHNSGTASATGTLTNTVQYVPGGFNSSTHGYCYGGRSNAAADTSRIERIIFPFASGIASNVGNLSGSKYSTSGCNSTNYGFSAGGYRSSYLSIIDKIIFPFDSGTANNIGNLSQSKYYTCGIDNTDFVSQFI